MMTACVSLAGCLANTGTRASLNEIAEQAARKAAAEASGDIGPQPAECYEDTPHAALVRGEEQIVLLRRERGQVDKANAKQRRCANYNEALRINLQGKPTPRPRSAE